MNEIYNFITVNISSKKKFQSYFRINVLIDLLGILEMYALNRVSKETQITEIKKLKISQRSNVSTNALIEIQKNNTK